MSWRDPAFKYTPSTEMRSDYLAKKFKKIELARKEAEDRDRAERDAKVRKINGRKGA